MPLIKLQVLMCLDHSRASNCLPSKWTGPPDLGHLNIGVCSFLYANDGMDEENKIGSHGENLEADNWGHTKPAL